MTRDYRSSGRRGGKTRELEQIADEMRRRGFRFAEIRLHPSTLEQLGGARAIRDAVGVDDSVPIIVDHIARV